MATGTRRLRDALALLHDLTATDHDRAAVAELLRRYDERALRVLVAGEAKRGKSTLVNALLGQPLLPTGVVPLTAITTTVVFGETPEAEVQFADGTRRVVPVGDVAQFVTETGNPDNRLGVSQVVISTPAQLLVGGVELVDTPGTGSVHHHNTDEATVAYERMDAAVFVLTVDPPISDSERRLVETIRDAAVTTWFVLNKVDRLPDEDVKTAVEFTRGVLEKLIGSAPEIWPVSAISALEADHPKHTADRFDEFEAAFSEYLRQSSASDLARSLSARGKRIAQALVDRDDTSIAVATMSDQAEATALQDFADCLRNVERDRVVTRTQADATIQRLINETDEAAQALISGNNRQILAEVKAFLDGYDKTSKELEAQGLALATKLITAKVDEWRDGWLRHLDDSLASSERELAERLERHIGMVRETAARLFGTTLSRFTLDHMLIETDRFSYQFQPSPGQYDTMAAALRRVVPNHLARRWVTRYVMSRSATLFDQQVGRARSEFRRGLTEAGRRTQSVLDSQYQQGAGALVDAIEAGTALRRSTQTGTEATLTALRAHREAAARLLAAFDPAMA